MRVIPLRRKFCHVYLPMRPDILIVSEHTGFDLTDSLRQLLSSLNFKRICSVTFSRVSLPSPRETRDGITRKVAVTVQKDGTAVTTKGSYYIEGIVVPESSFPLFISLLGVLLALGFAPSARRLFKSRPSQSSPDAATETCLDCNKPVRIGVKFCPYCGQKLCPHCRAALNRSANFCPKCGNQVN